MKTMKMEQMEEVVLEQIFDELEYQYILMQLKHLEIFYLHFQEICDQSLHVGWNLDYKQLANLQVNQNRLLFSWD